MTKLSPYVREHGFGLNHHTYINRKQNRGGRLELLCSRAGESDKQRKRRQEAEQVIVFRLRTWPQLSAHSHH